MEFELEPRVKPLSFKVKASSRESSNQKAANVLDSDLRTHWSTGTNTKEWILLELDEPCLLSNIRIYNKSVLEWEITVGLRYKPETFVKVRPRCEAPRRDMLYPMNYTACKYIRISCLRGNPIAIFFIQVIGVSVNGLEPEFQPVITYLLPHILSHKHDAHDMHLQLLQDISKKLAVFLPQLENDLHSFPEAADLKIRFFAMLVGPFYPILHLVNERAPISDPYQNRSSPTLTISSNFEVQPRRGRNALPFNQVACSSIAFRSEAVFLLLRKAYENSHLGTVCRIASRVLKIFESNSSLEEMMKNDYSSTACEDDGTKCEESCFVLNDYSGLFGDEFKIHQDQPDDTHTNLLDIYAVEEAIFHVLYASASEPNICRTLAENVDELWPLLPLIQALLPALQPPSISTLEPVDETFFPWKGTWVQRALAQIASVSSSVVSRSLVKASAGYLLSFQHSQVRAACLLIDLHFGPLAPWTSAIVAKIDLSVELVEFILDVGQSTSLLRAALKYVILGLSGHLDDVLTKYKEVKGKILFLVEMLEPFLEPAISASKHALDFGDVTLAVTEKQKETCAIALNIIRTAVGRVSILPSLESEWRLGTVESSVLLSVLGPNMIIPDEIDFCKHADRRVAVSEASPVHAISMTHNVGQSDECDVNSDPQTLPKSEVYEDAYFLFAPTVLKNMDLTIHNFPEVLCCNRNVLSTNSRSLEKNINKKFLFDPFQNSPYISNISSIQLLNFHSDYLQLAYLDDAEKWSTKFQHLAVDLHKQVEVTPECHSAAIDALLLAAECYVNPFFMTTFRNNTQLLDQKITFDFNIQNQKTDTVNILRNYQRNVCGAVNLFLSETRRDKIVLELLLKAANWEKESNISDFNGYFNETGNSGYGVKMSVEDMESADAITLLRQNEAMFCQFLTHRLLLRGQSNLHEVLLHALYFYLRTTTELFCSPIDIIEIILKYAEHLNKLITSFYHGIRDHKEKLEGEKSYCIRRHCNLLQNLVMASSRSDIGLNSGMMANVSHFGSLIPFVSWVQKISMFCNSPYTLVRYVGWMALSSFAKEFVKEQLFFTLELSALTDLLSIFFDELALFDDKVNQRAGELPLDMSSKELGGCEVRDNSHGHNSISVPYPDLHMFFPDFKLQFRTFAEFVLDAVALQLKVIPVVALSDVLCWFSGFCLEPYPSKESHQGCLVGTGVRGNVVRNTKAVILYLLEAILSVHAEAMVPEMPHIAQILISLCKVSYCDVDFLDTFLCVLKPLMSYSLEKASDVERSLQVHTSYHDFENTCFGDFFDQIRGILVCLDDSTNSFQGPLMVFLLGTLFSYLSTTRKKDILQYVISRADFMLWSPSSYLDYLKAFQNLIHSCIELLLQTLQLHNVLVPGELQARQIVSGSDNCPRSSTNISSDSCVLPTRIIHLSLNEMEEILIFLEELFIKLLFAFESCWRFHSQVAHKITKASGRCYLLMRCMTSLRGQGDMSGDTGNSGDGGLVDSELWKSAVEGLTMKIFVLQDKHCWQVASVLLDLLLGLGDIFSLDHVISSICSTMKAFCCHAPRISWRLLSDKWLSIIVNRPKLLHYGEPFLLDLFCAMLDHTEPEQRAVALKHLGGLVGLNISDGVLKLSYGNFGDNASLSSDLVIAGTPIFSLVSKTWDKITTLASSDPLLSLRSTAMAVLSGFIPFVEKTQLQYFFASSDSILPGARLIAHPAEATPMLLSLSLLARACFYSSIEDIHLIPENVWSFLDSINRSNSGLGKVERKICEALCNIRREDLDAKEVLNKALPPNFIIEKSYDDFQSTHESILEVLATITSLQSCVDIVSKKIDQRAQELEEAEIEMEILSNENVTSDCNELPAHGSSFLKSEEHSLDGNRLVALRKQIHDIERSRLKAEVAARRQKKLLAQHARQKYLEEAASREMELLQELDRERSHDMEREIERQRNLEIERAKTRMLRYNIDLEREKQTQRELQKELVQVESGVQVSRREFPSTSSSGRTRERYRDRDGGRMGNEVITRPNSRGLEHVQTSTTSLQTPTVVLSGSNRSFSGSIPTILQARDRSDERGTGYDESFDGSRDSIDSENNGDPDTASGFDGLPGGFGPGGRLGARGGKSRQIIERREREGRREGKWERKHS